jgi:hypothetical protein
MTTPATEAFKRERGRTLGIVRVFEYCQQRMDHVEIRRLKLDELVLSLEIDKGDASRWLDWLVSRGYLVEHERDDRGVRRFTLAWSLNPEHASHA